MHIKSHVHFVQINLHISKRANDNQHFHAVLLIILVVSIIFTVRGIGGRYYVILIFDQSPTQRLIGRKSVTKPLVVQRSKMDG